jgi:hypothetical protein
LFTPPPPLTLLHLPRAQDRARLVALYALRYEAEGSRVSALLDALRQGGLGDTHPELLAATEAVLGWAGQDR